MVISNQIPDTNYAQSDILKKKYQRYAIINQHLNQQCAHALDGFQNGVIYYFMAYLQQKTKQTETI